MFSLHKDTSGHGQVEAGCPVNEDSGLTGRRNELRIWTTKGETFMVLLEWSRPSSGSTSGRWWSFREIVESDSLPRRHGVFCIFQRSPRKYRTIYVGRGRIRDRIQDHMREPNISARPYLLVTWAETHPSQTDGIEKYLIDALHPLEGGKAPDAEPIEVNLPYKV
jgi:hypothetical protein